MVYDWFSLWRRVTGLLPSHFYLCDHVTFVQWVICPLDEHDWAATVVGHFVESLWDIFVHGFASSEDCGLCKWLREAILWRAWVLIVWVILVKNLIYLSFNLLFWPQLRIVLISFVRIPLLFFRWQRRYRHLLLRLVWTFILPHGIHLSHVFFGLLEYLRMARKSLVHLLVAVPESRMLRLRWS